MCQTDGDIPTIDKCNVIVDSIKIFNQTGGVKTKQPVLDSHQVELSRHL